MLTPFYIWQDTRVSAHWNYSFDMHHWYWGHVSCFLYHESPQGTPSGSDGFMVGNIHCLPKCQATFFVCKKKFSPFFQYKNICFLGIFQDFCFFFFFFKLYSSSLSTVQWKFYFHFCFLYWFSLRFIRVFPLYFSEQLKKEIGKFYDFLKKYISRLIFSSFLDIYLLHTAVFPLHSCEFQIIFSIFFDFWTPPILSLLILSPTFYSFSFIFLLTLIASL